VPPGKETKDLLIRDVNASAVAVPNPPVAASRDSHI